jgi:hypothetical protein
LRKKIERGIEPESVEIVPVRRSGAAGIGEHKDGGSEREGERSETEEED